MASRTYALLRHACAEAFFSFFFAFEARLRGCTRSHKTSLSIIYTYYAKSLCRGLLRFSNFSFNYFFLLTVLARKAPIDHLFPLSLVLRPWASSSTAHHDSCEYYRRIKEGVTQYVVVKVSLRVLKKP